MSQARSRARRAAMQALYQWQIAKHNIRDIESQFMAEQDMTQVDGDYFGTLLHGVPKQLDVIDAELAQVVDREVQQVDPIELALLRIGVYEFMFQLDVPYKVVINEAVELAKKYGAEDGHKYINGVLDKLARKLRAVECSARAGSSR
jgi:N utilization substance protein B